MSDIANTSSPMPSVIMAKGVPAFLVVTKPSTTANPAPARPPASGIRLTGIGRLASPTATKAWMATKAPRPVYTAWPKLSMPPWPSSTLYERQATMAMPICDSRLTWKLPLKTMGATSSNSANRPHSTQRPTFQGLK